MRWNWILLTFALLPFTLKAQIYMAPQPLMYRAALSLESPGKGVEHVRVSRYIPGARFPDSWDLMVEERKYDSEGRLTQWKRFDTYSGQRISEKNVRYNAQGDRIEERNWRMETQRDEVMKFENVYDPAGKFQSASVVDAAGKNIGTIKLLPDGSRETTTLNNMGQRFVLVTNAKGQLLSSIDESTKSQDQFQYDAQGELTGVQRTRAGKTVVYAYQASRDASGRIIMQDEILPEGQRRMFFEYDAAGHLIARKWDPARPTEAYSYSPTGALTDILQYGLDGYPKEIQAYFTDVYP